MPPPATTCHNQPQPQRNTPWTPQVRSESLELYRVLALFSKTYNNWYVHWDSDQVVYVAGDKKYKMLVHMVRKDEEE